MERISIPIDAPWRGCSANYRQPMNPDDVLHAEFWLSRINCINCHQLSPPLREIVYRSSSREEDILRHVFRWDLTPYQDVFRNGIQARRREGTRDVDYCNLFNYVHRGGRPLDSRRPTKYVFVSTTISSNWHPKVDPGIERVVYRYEIYAPGGIWVAPTLADRYGFKSQDEVCFVGGIAPQYIRSAQAFTLSFPVGSRFTRRARADTSIIINRYFNPQWETRLQIQNPVRYYFEEKSQLLCLEEVIYPPADHELENREVSIDANTTVWYAVDVANCISYINAAFRSSRENEAYLFMKNQYVLVKYAPGTSYDDGEDRSMAICLGYPSLTHTAFAEHGIDCAFGSHHENEAFIFSGNLCAHINYAPYSLDDKIIKGPITIASMFEFFKGTVFEKGVDAAFESSTRGRAYIFRGGHYAVINYGYDNPPSLFAIRQINEHFLSLKGTIFENGIDAAFASHQHNEAYLFKGDSYARINFAEDYIIGGVRKISTYWPSLADTLPVKNRGLDLYNFHEFCLAPDPNRDPDRDQDEL